MFVNIGFGNFYKFQSDCIYLQSRFCTDEAYGQRG